MVVDQGGNEKQVFPLKLDAREGPANIYHLYLPANIYTAFAGPEEKQAWDALHTYRGRELSRTGEPERTLTEVTGVQFKRETVKDETGQLQNAFVTTVMPQGEDKWYAGNVAHELAELKRKLSEFERPLEFSIPDEFTFVDKRNGYARRTITPKEFKAEEWLTQNEAATAPLRVVQTARAGEFLAGFKLPESLTGEYSSAFLDDLNRGRLSSAVNNRISRMDTEPPFQVVANSRGTDRPDYYLAMKVTAPNADAVLARLQNWHTQDTLKGLINAFGWNQFTADNPVEVEPRMRAG